MSANRALIADIADVADCGSPMVEVQAQLQRSQRHQAQRTRELRELGRMMTGLIASLDMADAAGLIGTHMPRLFEAGDSCGGGVVWIEQEQTGWLAQQARWGRVNDLPLAMAAVDCRALSSPLSLRLPIIALGQTVGLIHLEWRDRLHAEETRPEPEWLACIAQQMGLAIANIRLAEELGRQSVRDPLTGLHNRRQFDEMLKVRIADHRRNGRCFSLLLIDIDHFSQVNGQYGRAAGDQVLRELAATLQRTRRVEEPAFRIGGEQFVLMIDDRDGSQAGPCADRIRREIGALPVPFKDRLLPPVTVSIGVAHYPADLQEGISLLQRADTALYSAKHTGRNKVCHAGAVPRSPD